MEPTINWIAVVTAAVINMILGGLWYAPKVFGTAWAGLVGMTEEKQKKGAGRALGWAVLCSLVTAVVLAYALNMVRKAFPGAPLSFFNGVMAGVWLWAGFTFATIFSSYQFNQHPPKLAAIDLGYPLLSYALMGGLLAAWV